MPGLERLRREVFEVLDYDTVVVLDSHWHTTVEFVVAAQPVRAGLFTSDELASTCVNGTAVQHGSTDEMRWDMHNLVADIARTITLLPGDVLLSGTPANSRPVQPGDVVEVEVDGLGRLANRVVAGPLGVAAEFGAQPSAREEVLSTALGGDWEFRGIRPPARS